MTSWAMMILVFAEALLIQALIVPPAKQHETSIQSTSDCPAYSKRVKSINSNMFEDELRELGIGLAPEACQMMPQETDLVGSERRSDRKPIMWIHVHKSAGTTMCALARINGERIIHPNFNCDWWPHDTVSGGSRMNVSCKKRAEAFTMQGATFGMIEHVIEKDYLCPKHFNYVLMLRDPNQLAVSKANYGGYNKSATILSMMCVTEKQCGRKDTGDRGQGGHVLWWFFDNFLTRTFGGSVVFALPPGAITHEHADTAIETISKFNTVMFVDELKQTTPPAVELALGWHRVAVGTRNQSPGKVSLNANELKIARMTNKQDYTIYEHFKKIEQRNRFGKLF